LKPAEKNYLVHEKELLAIIRALKKWQADLLGTYFFVYIDHKMLENFDVQKDLSRRQLHWQEFLSQYDMTIKYIPGQDNTVADALSHLPSQSFPDKVPMDMVVAPLHLSVDKQLLTQIKEGYSTDEFCKHVTSSNMPS
jgi:RNase H-like domain found in reverse transcriptase/Integrase zinc binding domain